MFDIAYDSEAIIEAAERETIKLWDKLINHDLGKSNVMVFCDTIEIERIIEWLNTNAEVFEE